MAVNLALKYRKGISQAHALKSLTKEAFGIKADFIGVSTVRVYTLTSQPLVDYTRTGANRYGTPAELQDTVQEMTLSKDRGFSITVDKGNFIQGDMQKTTGNVIKIQLEERFIPEQDTYNLTVLAAAATAASQVATAAVTASNAYEKFLDGTVALDNDKTPKDGRIAFVSPTFFKFIRLDNSFMRPSEITSKALINGQIGEIDGVKIVMVPASYLPANVSFILTHKDANVAPMQLEDINVFEKAQGISGALIEGRFIYDAFVMTPRIKSNYMHKTA
jgi:hypothetical protein